MNSPIVVKVKLQIRYVTIAKKRDLITTTQPSMSVGFANRTKID